MPLRTDGVAQETEALGADGERPEKRGGKSIMWRGCVYSLATDIAGELTLAECVELGRCLLDGRRGPVVTTEAAT